MLMKPTKEKVGKGVPKNSTSLFYTTSSFRATGGCYALKTEISKVSGAWPQNILPKITTDNITELWDTEEKQNVSTHKQY